MSRTRFRKWCFTLNNPSDTDKGRLLQVPCNFIIFQLEQGASGTRHFQGAIAFRHERAMKGIKTVIGPTAHLEPMMGTWEQAKAYCTKEDTRIDGPWSEGKCEPVGPGRRSDLQDVVLAIKEGKSTAEIIQDHTVQYIKYYRGIERVIAMTQLDRTTQTEIHVYWGEGGSGKSTWAKRMMPPDYFALSRPQGQSGSLWWDGYLGTEDILLDDFYGWIAFADFLQLGNHTKWSVQTKGGVRKFNSSRVYITSNDHPREWYKAHITAHPNHHGPFYRRLTSVTHVTSHAQQEAYFALGKQAEPDLECHSDNGEWEDMPVAELEPQSHHELFYPDTVGWMDATQYRDLQLGNIE